MKQLVLLYAFLFILICNAQLKHEFKKGWVINYNNEKIEGFIENNDLEELSTNICFKQNLEDKECKKYTTKEIKSFQTFDGYTYDLLFLKTNKSQNQTYAFANLVIKGEQLSLYKSIYNSKIIYILSKNNENYVLQNDELVSGESQIRRYNYKGILNFITDGLAFQNNSDINFSENDFSRAVIEYNNSKNSETKDLRIKEKSIGFLITNGGIGYGSKNASEYYGQIAHRMFFPKISKGISLNIGLSYYNYKSIYQYNEVYTKIQSGGGETVITEQTFTFNRDIRRSLLTFPAYIQHNFLHKNIRPYLFGGFALNRYRIEDNSNSPSLKDINKLYYSANFIFGLGIEADVYKNYYLKCEYRFDVYSHPILFGVGYIFK